MRWELLVALMAVVVSSDVARAGDYYPYYPYSRSSQPQHDGGRQSYNTTNGWHTPGYQGSGRAALNWSGNGGTYYYTPPARGWTTRYDSHGSFTVSSRHGAPTSWGWGWSY